MKNMKSLTSHPKYWLSGAVAQQFRRNLSRTAGGRQSGVTLSHKFLLAAEPLNTTARDALREEYRLSSATAENTLFHFFTALHLAGFRLFTNTANAEMYLNDSTLAQCKLNEELEDCFGLQKNQTKALLTELAKDSRATNRNKESLAKKLTDIFKPDEDSDLGRFIQEIAREIADKELWGPQNKEKRWQAVNTAAEALKFAPLTLPQLREYKFPLLWCGKEKSYLEKAVYSAASLEFAMHQMVAFAAHVAHKDKAKINADDIKTILLSDTSNYNGIDWLLNRNSGGIRLLAQSAKEIREQGLHIEGCPPEHLQDIRNIAQSLLGASLVSYHKHRSLFGGNISSSVSNYWERLEQLEKGIDNIKIESAPDIQQVLTDLEQNKQETFSGIITEYEAAALPISHLQDLISDLINKKTAAYNALTKLMGKDGAQIAGKAEVETIEDFNDIYEETKGLYMQLAEKLKAKNNDKDYSLMREKFPSLKFFIAKETNQEEQLEDTSKFLKRKINRYRGAQVFTEQQINEELEQKFNQLKNYQQMREKHWKKIKDKYQIDIIAAREEVERTRLENDPKKDITKYNIPELACRNILHRLASSLRRLGDANIFTAGMKLFQDKQVFANDKDGAKFFKDNKGRIYVSPYARYDHQGYELSISYKQNIRKATNAFIAEFCQWVRKVRATADNIKAQRDAAQLEHTMYGLLCGSVLSKITEEDELLNNEELEQKLRFIAAEDAQLNNKELKQKLPVSLKLALQRETISPGELARLFNIYASEINGLCAILARKEIIAKSRLQHIGDKDFYYLPKGDKNWTLPEQMFGKNGTIRGESALARGWHFLQEDDTLFTNKQKTAIRADKLPEAIQKLNDTLRKEQDGEQLFRACLRQIPHDWYYKNTHYPVLSMQEEESFPRPIDKDGYLIGLWQLKEGKTLRPAGKKEKSTRYLRLTGTSSHKGWLDDVLLGKASFGDSSLIIEEEYEQQYTKGAITAQYIRTRLEVATVFKYSAETAAKKVFSPAQAKHFIAIDLGERGIGYAVYEIPEQGNGGKLERPVCQGHVVIPILRRLIRRVDTYRRREQPRQRFQSNMNTALQQMREATIGEVTGIVDALMEKHRAFPVFESSVGGFESGGRMLKMVYGSILQRYIYSDVDAHKAKRKNHWQASNAPMWKHATLKSLNKENKKLNMFPGVAVHPAGTSQICSHCELNPLDLVEEDTKDLKTDEAGILTLPLPGKKGNNVRLYIYSDEDKHREKESENAFPTFGSVCKNTTFKNKDALRKHLKKMLRHPPLTRQSKDTSQSTYLSPFVDTQEALAKLSEEDLRKQNRWRRNGLVFMHADINAAVNIGKKWWIKINSAERASKKKTTRK